VPCRARSSAGSIRRAKAYRGHPDNQQVELIFTRWRRLAWSTVRRNPRAGAVGRPDGEVRGGHLRKPSPGRPWKCFHHLSTTLIKKHDEETTFSFLIENVNVVFRELHTKKL